MEQPGEENTNKGSRIAAILKAIARGEFLFTLKCDKFFPHIIYFFFLICMVLIINLMIERTMVVAEQNKEIISTMKIVLTHKNSELISLGKMSKVQQMLQESGSNIGIPDQPATILK